MLKRFKKGHEDTKESQEKQIAVEGQQAEMEESLSLLTKTDEDSVEAVITEVEMAVKDAARESLKDLKLLEEGRCPDCGRKTERFLFTTVCVSCGWSSFISPQEGRVLVHLRDGTIVECGRTFDTARSDVLCIKDEVVIARVAKDYISYVEYNWTEEEITKKKAQKAREVTGACDWCTQAIKQGSEETVISYAALGNYQERYIFCNDRCHERFQKMYPARVHRNCYERSCIDCEECLVKKYDASDETILQKEELVG